MTTCPGLPLSVPVPPTVPVSYSVSTFPSWKCPGLHGNSCGHPTVRSGRQLGVGLGGQGGRGCRIHGVRETS